MKSRMSRQFVLGDGQFYPRNCEYCEWLYVYLLRLLYNGQSIGQFDSMYLRHVFGNGLNSSVRDRQVEKVVEVVEPL